MKSIDILNLRLGNIGGNTTNFLDGDQLKKYDNVIQSDSEMLSIMNDVNKLYEDWKNVQLEYVMKGRYLRDLATKRFKELTGEKYV